VTVRNAGQPLGARASAQCGVRLSFHRHSPAPASTELVLYDGYAWGTRL
jgi:hypothetical protein